MPSITYGLLLRLVAAAPDDDWLVARLVALDWADGIAQLDRLCRSGLISPVVCDRVWSGLADRAVDGV